MSVDSDYQKFRSMVLGDAKLVERLKQQPDTDAVIDEASRIAGELGIPLTADILRQGMQESEPVAGGELSDADFEAVAGGTKYCWNTNPMCWNTNPI